MTTHESDDAQIDTVLDALSRPELPEDHLARVLAATGRPAGPVGVSSRSSVWTVRRAVPIAATLLLCGGVWMLPQFAAAPSPAATAPSTSWGQPRDVDRPVLPPEAYWGMDAFEEWDSLRPGSRHDTPGTRHQASRRVGSALAGAQATEPPSLAAAPGSSGLPPIDLEPIAATPIELAPLAALDEIAVSEIPLAPIDIAPLDQQETP